MWADGIVEENRDLQYGITANTRNIKLNIRQKERMQKKKPHVLGCQKIHPFGYLVGEAKKIFSVQSQAIFLQNLTDGIRIAVWIT